MKKAAPGRWRCGSSVSSVTDLVKTLAGLQYKYRIQPAEEYEATTSISLSKCTLLFESKIFKLPEWPHSNKARTNPSIIVHSLYGVDALVYV